MSFEIVNRYTRAVLYASETANDIATALPEAVSKGANLSGADLIGANLHGANLREAYLSGADLIEADLHGANLHGANLHGANLSGANLHGANLSGADLHEANLSGADLIEADLHGANLHGANLHEANLHGANLHGANLHEANLHGANLHGANLSGADLSGANLHGAYLREADLPLEWQKYAIPGLEKRIAEIVLAKPEETLDMGAWHTCETTHCLAGWAVHLAGPAGYALESLVGSQNAGVMLMPSARHLFHASNDEALAWLREQLEKA